MRSLARTPKNPPKAFNRDKKNNVTINNSENIEVKWYESALFINSKDDLSSFFKSDKKKFFQTTFYKQQRKDRNILIVGDDEPEVGRWSYDDENANETDQRRDGAEPA